MVCDFCQSKKVIEVYNVPTSEKDVVIAICDNCGLVQSIAKKKKNNKRLIKASSDADWGNIRQGKGLRLPKAIEVLTPFLKNNKIKEVLDIGSNRGDFVLWLRAQFPKININAIEPDKQVVDAYKTVKGINLSIERFEKNKLAIDKFDLIYCSHTLEHADSSKEMLEGCFNSLKNGGYLFLEVPNIEIIAESDIVEEFFIDKHTFHFNRELLVDFLKQLGFSVIFGENEKDVSNITLLLKKDHKQVLFNPQNKKFATTNKKLIVTYQKLFKKNKIKLYTVANKLYIFMQRQKVVLWGGGRIFDALVKYGGLKTDKIVLLIDDYLSKYVSEVHGVKLHNSKSLRLVNADVVIILAKNSTKEIYQQVKKFGIRHVFRFNDLLNE